MTAVLDQIDEARARREHPSRTSKTA
jgi:hypothetical protein